MMWHSSTKSMCRCCRSYSHGRSRMIHNCKDRVAHCFSPRTQHCRTLCSWDHLRMRIRSQWHLGTWQQFPHPLHHLHLRPDLLAYCWARLSEVPHTSLYWDALVVTTVEPMASMRATGQRSRASVESQSGRECHKGHACTWWIFWRY